MERAISRQPSACAFCRGRYLVSTLAALFVILAGGALPCRALDPTPADAQWIAVTTEGCVDALDIRPGQRGDGVRVIDVSGKEKGIPLASCLGLMRKSGTRTDRRSRRDGRVSILLDSGETILAANLAYKDNFLSVHHPLLGRLSIAFDRVRKIRVQRSAALPEPNASFEGVRFVNGDEVAGKVASIDGETILVAMEGIGKVPVEGFDTVADIILGPSTRRRKKPPPADPRMATIRCRGGDLVKGTILGEKAGRWLIQTTLKTEPLRIAAGRIESVGFLAEHVFLSDMRPSRVTLIPFLDSVLPWRADASLDNDSLAVGGYKALKGLALHSSAALTFPLGKLSSVPRRFCCLLGMDDSSFPGAGDADFILSINGRTVQKKRIVSGARLLPIYADVPVGAKTLGIKVDYGRKGSMGDHVDALWAALVPVKQIPPKQARPSDKAPPKKPAP